eukprot:11546894-Alexandrium_andersonii.AAC.1
MPRRARGVGRGARPSEPGAQPRHRRRSPPPSLPLRDPVPTQHRRATPGPRPGASSCSPVRPIGRTGSRQS